MKIIKIVDGTIHIVNERGIALFPVFGKDITSAFYNDSQDLIVLTDKKGKVELRTERGLLRRVVMNAGVSSARFQGNNLQIIKPDGKNEIRSQTGLLIRVV